MQLGHTQVASRDSDGYIGTVHYTDEALLVSGDLEDFGLFYDRYVRSLLAFFQRRTYDPEVAADLTAETFAPAMIARRRYEARTSTAASWLFAIAQHKLADYHRRGSAENRMRARLGMEPVPVSAEDAEMIRWLGEEVAAQMVEDLPPDQHFAIVIDDRIVALPYIGYQESPDGIDGAGGAQVQGGLTPATARRIAALLSAGPLPEGLALDAG